MSQRALLCPGQGVSIEEVARYVLEDPYWSDVAPIVSSITGGSSLEDVLNGSDADILNSNEVSAIFVVLSAIFTSRRADPKGVSWISGYSVGMFAAMHLAEMMDLARTLEIVWNRCRLMSEAAEHEKGAMLAVIGRSRVEIEDTLLEAGLSDLVWISNFNCNGNYTLSGTSDGIQVIRGILDTESTRKLIDLPVAGAWHTPMMQQAADKFADYLSDFSFSPPRVPVFNSATGAALTSGPEQLRTELARHMVLPVHWETVIRNLIAEGANEFIELGAGTALSEFGFYIDRSFRHIPVSRIRSKASL